MKTHPKKPSSFHGDSKLTVLTNQALQSDERAKAAKNKARSAKTKVKEAKKSLKAAKEDFRAARKASKKARKDAKRARLALQARVQASAKAKEKARRLAGRGKRKATPVSGVAPVRKRRPEARKLGLTNQAPRESLGA